MKDAPEGWEWVRIQESPCPQCGQHPAGVPPGELAALAVGSVAGWQDFLSGADDAFLRTNPRPDIWSPIQYGAHVRDMLRVFGDRILVAVKEDNPSVGWFDPGPDGWESYNRMPVDDLAADLGRQAGRFASIIEERSPSDWSRTAMRDGVDRFTVAGLACFGAHEAHHHLLDARGRI
jgi:hypothetical protein